MSEFYIPPRPPKSFISGGEFFYGANTGNGFKEYYSSFVNEMECDRIYNIIGGPGTGKSTLMKKIANECKSNGCLCEYYFCSSDPQSLDCVRIFSSSNGKTVAICDATAPHERGFNTPGAVSEIIDLSKFWSTEKLEKKKKAIISRQDEKRCHFLNAYKYIKITSKANAVIEKELSDLVDTDILVKLSLEILGSTRKTGAGTCIFERPTAALSMHGEKLLENNEFDQKNRYVLQDIHGTAYLLIKQIMKLANSRGHAIFASPSCDRANCYNEIYIPSKKLVLSVFPKEDQEIITTRDLFYRRIPKKTRSVITSLEKVAKKAKESALHELGLAKTHHFALEEIYGEAMNFDAKDCLTAKW